MQAFGINAKLKTAKGKKANLVDIAKNFRNKTNDYLEKYAVKDFEKSPSSDNINFNQNEPLYADGDKVRFDNNAPYLRLVAEGWQITKELLKTGTVSENVYLDKTRNQVVLHAPGLVTGCIEVVAQKVTDLTSLGTLVYDIATSEETRSNLALQFKNIKDEIGEDPKAFFPIFRDVVLTVTTGNTPKEWDKSINSKDSGERSHLATRGTGNAILTLMSGAAIVKNLPEIAQELGKNVRKSNIFRSARQRAIAKFGKDAEEMIYVKFNKDGGAAAEIIAHYDREGLDALKRVNTIEDVPNELIKGKIAYRHVGSDVNYLEKLKETGIIPEQIGQGTTYFSLDKIDNPIEAIDRMQLNKKYNDAIGRLEFDTEQLLGKVKFPKAK